MGFMRTILKRPVSVIVLLAAIIVYGLASLTGMPLNFMPDFDMPMQLLLITWPGADADSIDRLVTKPVSDECETLTDISSVSSFAYDNYTMIQLIYEYSADTDDMYADLKSTIDTLMPDLPDDCGDPVIMELSMDATATLTASAVIGEGIDAAEFLNDTVVPALESLNGVAQVEVSGIEDDYMRIILDEGKLQQYNLSMTAVGSAIAGADFDIPIGEVTLGAQDVSLSMEGSFDAGPGIGSFPVQTPAGKLVRLDDLTQAIYLAKEDADTVSRYNGQQSILLNVTRQDSEAAVGVCNDVLEVLDGFQDNGVRFEIINNEADNILEALRCVLETILTGILLAMAVLFLFFGDWKASLVVGISMPLSVFLAVILLGTFGFDLNVMSGTGLILAIGMIVDNSIVILESCFRSRADGMDFQEAAVRGTSTMLLSILAGTLTTVVVYLPLAMSSGLAGMLFGPLLWTIVLTMLASFLCAVVVVPLAFYRLKPKEKEQLPINRLLERCRNGYRRVMPRLLRHPWRVMLVAVACFAGAILLAMQMEFVMMPNNYDGSISVEVSFRSGTRLEVMDQRVQTLEKALLADENFENITLDISEGTATFTAYAVDDCTRSSEAAVEFYTEQFRSVHDMDVSVSPFASTAGMGPMAGASNAKSVMLMSDSMETLEEGAALLQEAMAQTPGVIRVENPFDQTRMKGILVVDPQKVLSAGLTEAAVAMQGRSMLEGLTATTIEYGDSEYDVVLEYPEGGYEDVLSLMDHSIQTPSGQLVTLGDIAGVRYTTVLPVIGRQDGAFTATLTATTTDSAKYSAADAIDAAGKELEFPQGVRIGVSAQDSASNDEVANFAMALLSSLFLVFLVMAVQFNSARLSIMVMLCIPLSLIGSFGLAFLSGSPLTLFGLMGFMMLIGITVNNGIYLVDGTTQLRQTMSLEKALIEAGATRLRPILMTTLTTVISMLPMAFTTDSAMSMMKEMAFIVIGGLIASTVLAMFLVPAFYLIMRGERVDRNRKQRILKKKMTAKS